MTNPQSTADQPSDRGVPTPGRGSSGIGSRSVADPQPIIIHDEQGDLIGRVYTLAEVCAELSN